MQVTVWNIARRLEESFFNPDRCSTMVRRTLQCHGISILVGLPSSAAQVSKELDGLVPDMRKM